MKIAGIIPFRKGSKRVPNKPMKEIKEKPLIYYTIKQALQSKSLCEVFITSDFEVLEVQPILDKINKKILNKPIHIIRRPDHTCRDESLYQNYLDHFLSTEYKKEQYKDIEAICLLQPTCPIRFKRDIDSACRLFNQGGLPTLVSAYSISKNLLYDKNYKTFYAPEYDKNNIIYIRNSSIYIFTINYYRQHHTIYSNIPYIYEMPQYRSVDINHMGDFELCAKLIEGGILDGY